MQFLCQSAAPSVTQAGKTAQVPLAPSAEPYTGPTPAYTGPLATPLQFEYNCTYGASGQPHPPYLFY